MSITRSPRAFLSFVPKGPETDIVENLNITQAGTVFIRCQLCFNLKVEPYEMKMAVLLCLATPVAILIGSGVACMVPGITLTNTGAHGFSEILYAFTSAGGNNGSAFAGLDANTPFMNLSTELLMLFARYVPMVAALAMAGSLAQKKKVAVGAGTLPTHDAMFVGLLIFVILLIGALSFSRLWRLGQSQTSSKYWVPDEPDSGGLGKFRQLWPV